MSSKKYTIKPLVWEISESGYERGYHSAETPMGTISIRKAWRMFRIEMYWPNVTYKGFKSIEEAKAWAWRVYREQLLKGLEEVQ